MLELLPDEGETPWRGDIALESDAPLDGGDLIQIHSDLDRGNRHVLGADLEPKFESVKIK